MNFKHNDAILQGCNKAAQPPLGNTTNLSAPLVSQGLQEAVNPETGEIVSLEVGKSGATLTT